MIDRWLRHWITGGVNKPFSVGWVLCTMDERYNSHVIVTALFPSKAEAEAYGAAHAHEAYYAVEIFSNDEIRDW